MSRLATLFVLALALLQGSGVHVRLSAVACAGEHHEGEAPGADCPGECAACACCTRVIFAHPLPSPALAEPIAMQITYADSGANRLPSPPPRGILHVPKAVA